VRGHQRAGAPRIPGALAGSSREVAVADYRKAFKIILVTSITNNGLGAAFGGPH